MSDVRVACQMPFCDRHAVWFTLHGFAACELCARTIDATRLRRQWAAIDWQEDH